MSDLKCERCNAELEPDDDYLTLEDGTVLCQYCFEDEYAECDECGEITLRDDLQFWGETRICPNCMEGHCPSFDEKKNEKETTAAYEEMKSKYLGKKVIDPGPGIHTLYHDEDDWGEILSYEISVTIGEDYRILDISRLHASMMLSESERSSNWAPYRINEYDYDNIVEEMFDEEFVFDDEDE